MSQKQPWEQREGESDAAYARFLTYRGLGPGRTLDAAARAHGVGTRRNGVERAGGTWHDDSTRWSWVGRADAYDVHVICEAGARAAVRFVATLERLAQVALDAMARPEVAPKDAKELVEVVRALGDLIPAEAVAGARPVPADTTPEPERPRIAS